MQGLNLDEFIQKMSLTSQSIVTVSFNFPHLIISLATLNSDKDAAFHTLIPLFEMHELKIKRHRLYNQLRIEACGQKLSFDIKRRDIEQVSDLVTKLQCKISELEAKKGAAVSAPFF